MFFEKRKKEKNQKPCICELFLRQCVCLGPGQVGGGFASLKYKYKMQGSVESVWCE